MSVQKEKDLRYFIVAAIIVLLYIYTYMYIHSTIYREQCFLVQGKTRKV